jgi:hypothetical protein
MPTQPAKRPFRSCLLSAIPADSPPQSAICDAGPMTIWLRLFGWVYVESPNARVGLPDYVKHVIIHHVPRRRLTGNATAFCTSALDPDACLSKRYRSLSCRVTAAATPCPHRPTHLRVVCAATVCHRLCTRTIQPSTMTVGTRWCAADSSAVCTPSACLPKQRIQRTCACALRALSP